MRTRISDWSLVLVGGTLLAGCLSPDSGRGTQEDGSELVTTNGLSMINGLSMTNGLSMLNGLAANGLSRSARWRSHQLRFVRGARSTPTARQSKSGRT